MGILVNGSEWNILEKTQKEVVDKYNEAYDEDAKCVFGLTRFKEYEIWINKEMCLEQKIKTLKHELTHCYIFMYGLGQVPHFTEEMVCDLVSAITEFIDESVERYKSEMVQND